MSGRRGRAEALAAKTNRVVAIKAVAHKPARACYHIMGDGVEVDVRKAFA